MRDSQDPAGETAARGALAIGVDNLATLEELFGDALGDRVMAVLSRRLPDALPQGAVIRATPRRRFIVELPPLGAAAAKAVFGRLQAAASGLIDTAQGPMAVTVSAGWAAADDPVRAEQSAIQALHGAAEQGVGAFRAAGEDRELLDCRARVAETARAATRALGDERLTVAFQPVVSAKGGHVIAFHECLARIRRADGTLAPASSFMPAVEQLGLAPMIDRHVIEIAFDALARHPQARLSVNLFPQTMQDLAWMEAFDRAVARAPHLPERLIVELTETCSVLDPPRTLAFMERLRGQGVAFALDDFGASHTSLAYLREFRFDIVKIDGRFAAAVRHGSDDAFLVGKLVEIAERFDMMTVAERVPGPAEARCLADLGVEYFQGFWFGSPSLTLRPTDTPMPGVAAQA